MRVLMAHSKIKNKALKDFAAARDKIVSALSHEQRKGLRYTWCAMPDGTSFVGWLELDEAIENPLPGMEAGREFMRNLQSWVAEPPVRQELSVVGSYPPAL